MALGFFIPLLIGTGGNIGSQTVTLIVRAMALGEVAMRDIGWIVFKELRVGLIMGLVMGVVGVRAGRVPGRRRPTSAWWSRSRWWPSAPGPRPWPRRCR